MDNNNNNKNIKCYLNNNNIRCNVKNNNKTNNNNNIRCYVNNNSNCEDTRESRVGAPYRYIDVLVL